MTAGEEPEKQDLSEFRHIPKPPQDGLNSFGYSSELGENIENAKTVEALLGLYFDSDPRKLNLEVRANLQEAISLRLSNKPDGQIPSSIFFQMANDTLNTKLVLDSNRV